MAAESVMCSKDWYDEMWGRIVIAIGRGEGRGELVSILQYVALDRYTEGLTVGKQIVLGESKSHVIVPGTDTNPALLANADKLLTVMKSLLHETELHICVHDETERLGYSRTRCAQCGREWVDDEGGFQPDEVPACVQAAHDLLDLIAGKGTGIQQKKY